MVIQICAVLAIEAVDARRNVGIVATDGQARRGSFARADVDFGEVGYNKIRSNVHAFLKRSRLGDAIGVLG